MSQHDAHALQILANRRKIYKLESVVLANKFEANELRALIDECRSLILKNYSAAFAGNHRMASFNTEVIFKNRSCILASMRLEGQTQEICRAWKLDESRIGFLEHRSKLNSDLVNVSAKMAAVNSLYIAAIERIREVNAELLQFNAHHDAVNRSLLCGELSIDDATLESNADRIESNGSRIEHIIQRAAANKDRILKVLAWVKDQRGEILKNGDSIHERRIAIAADHEALQEDSRRVAELIGAGVLDAYDDQVKASACKLYELEGAVMANKFKACQERAFVEENQSLNLKNYAALFSGNRQMIDDSTDDIFRDRVVILSALKMRCTCHENFRDSMLSEAKIDLLEHRSKLNSRTLEMCEKLAEINSMLTEVNHSIMDGNAEIMRFNCDHLSINRQMVDGEIVRLSGASQSANNLRANANRLKIDEVTARARKNEEVMDGLLTSVRRNRQQIMNTSELIYTDRESIESDRQCASASGIVIQDFIQNGLVPKRKLLGTVDTSLVDLESEKGRCGCALSPWG
eukprot:TRINITY_DN1960_c1_g4_i1.p1 TRINITY_DN1960_c1_g4~~TRINITY_DN1960_c1_g4_i1.p1  ORF type:complete len:519 (+),score=84.28 TRINITY_DN1960_c1_g4_i1:54-1610(+)